MAASLLPCSYRNVHAKEPIYCLGFKSLGVSPGERLSKFDLHIISGIVVSLPRVPLGWQISIDNESNGMPEISGYAIEQAADLSERDFSTDLLRIARAPAGFVGSGVPKDIVVAGYVELSQRDTKRLMSISMGNIRLTPEQQCPPGGG